MSKALPNNCRSGKIKARVFALILIMFSCSMVMSAYKSLRREFSGILIDKKAEENIILPSYSLYLTNVPQNLTPTEIYNMLKSEELPTRRVGVSPLVYEQCEMYSLVSKKSFSFKIKVGEENFIDQGLVWLLFGLLGIILSLVMYYHTLPSPTSAGKNGLTEDIDIPGM